jgi:hypothetical protein
LFLVALTTSPILLWFLMGAAQEANIDPRLIYQNYSELGYAGGYQLSLWMTTATLLYFASFLVLKAKQRIKTTLPWLITGGVGVALSLAIVVATITLYRTTDGTEKFSGRELEVAQSALQAARDRDLGPLHMPWKYRVVSIHIAPSQPNCLIPQDTSNPANLSHYTATIEGVWLFDVHERFEQSLCQF